MNLQPPRLLDPSTDEEFAYQVSRGLAPATGLVILSPAEYFSRPVGSCLHPQGWPCFTSCRRPEATR